MGSLARTITGGASEAFVPTAASLKFTGLTLALCKFEINSLKWFISDQIRGVFPVTLSLFHPFPKYWGTDIWLCNR